MTTTKISLTQLRRILHVGAQFQAEFVGINARLAKPERVRTYRTVRAQNARHMVSTIDNDGELPGTEVWLNWNGVTAEQQGEFIVLIMNDIEPGEQFLKILLLKGN